MGRMTVKKPDGSWSVKDNDGKKIPWDEVEHRIYGALCKLLDYEETGLSPEEVEDMKAEKKWIPVSEAVPANDENVLVYVEHGKAGNVHFDGAYENGFFEPGTGWGLEDYPDVEELLITHWMPYPAPPKGVK